MTRAKQEVKNRVGDSPAIARGIRKKNSYVKPQKTLSSLKILHYSFLSALSVFSVVKNSCSVMLNYACSTLVGEFQYQDDKTEILNH